jgi:hypothetical protein
MMIQQFIDILGSYFKYLSTAFTNEARRSLKRRKLRRQVILELATDKLILLS